MRMAECLRVALLASLCVDGGHMLIVSERMRKGVMYAVREQRRMSLRDSDMAARCESLGAIQAFRKGAKMERESRHKKKSARSKYTKSSKKSAKRAAQIGVYISHGRMSA